VPGSSAPAPHAQTSGKDHPSLKDAAARFIREGIVSGRFRPGAKVDQDEIAGILGISRLPVREALIELAEKGFVTSIPRRGAFVVDLQVEDVEDHYKVLEMVFALAAGRAATACDEAQLVHLRAIHEEIAETNDPAVAESLNREFVSRINQAGSSPRLRAILRFLSGALPGSYYVISPEWATTEAKYRDLMLRALEAHDSDVAAQVAAEHLRECSRLTIEVLKARGASTSEPDGGDRVPGKMW
jgi:DNA-binding GntR family transcriptional regulator